MKLVDCYRQELYSNECKRNGIKYVLVAIRCSLDSCVRLDVRCSMLKTIGVANSWPWISIQWYIQIVYFLLIYGHKVLH